MLIIAIIISHSGARAKPANPESRTMHPWIPGPALRAGPE
jgi:hypothetical protein